VYARVAQARGERLSGFAESDEADTRCVEAGHVVLAVIRDRLALPDWRSFGMPASIKFSKEDGPQP
jgi:hypothetical protein